MAVDPAQAANLRRNRLGACAATLFETLRQALEQPLVRPRLVNPLVPRDLETICLKCLEKNPALRYASAEGVAEDLENWIEHRPIKGRSPGAAVLTWQWMKRNPAGTALIAGLFLGLLGLLVMLSSVRRQRNITPLENASGKLISDPTKTFEQLTPAGLSALGIVAVTKTVVLDSLTAIDPLLEKCEGVCVVGNSIVLTYDNDFNVADAASIPANPNPNGPFVQLELLGGGFPKLFVVPLP